MIDHTPVHSSSVETVGYDANTQELHVVWKSGKTSIYSNVPQSVARSASTAWSPGKFLKEEVQPNYAHRYL